MATNQYNSKIALSNGDVLMDLTGDDITPGDVTKGIKFHDKTGAPRTGTSTKTVDASEVTADPAEVLNGRTFGKGSAVEAGTMPDNSGNDVEISTTDGTIIPRGFYDGTTRAKLSAAELAKLIPGNIKEGETLLGIPGGYGADDITSQHKEVTPTFENQGIQPDAGYAFLSGVTVKGIKVTRVNNSAGGVTVTIG